MKIKFFKNKEDEKTTKAAAELKVHRKPKTERIYERVSDVIDFLNVVQKHGNRTAFSYFDSNRNVCSITYDAFTGKIREIAAGLESEGCGGKKIALIGETSVEWVASYLAILAGGGVAIPMDKELEIPVIEEFLASVEADAIIYSGSFNKKFDKTKTKHKSLSRFIPIVNEDGKNTVSIEKIIEQGKKAIRKGWNYKSVTDREKLAEMLFTSGTTGSSKCVMLSQKNIFSVVSSAAETVDFNPEDVVVSVLPIHHTYELACMLAELDYGVHICINDSLTHVLKNFQLFKPTGLVLVPLFVYTMYKKIWTEAKKTGRDKLLKVGIGAARTLMSLGIDKRREILSDVVDSFGGRLEKIICGGAALNPKMIDFFENFGISIYEGFGITECAPLTCVTPYYARKYGSVGPAVPCCQIRIDGQIKNRLGFTEGEIQVKGDNVMLGYYNNPDANENAFTWDGWFRTGDVGYMDSDSYIYITGRIKNVIVLENGKNISPEEIEEYLDEIEFISECVVVGRISGENVVLAAVVYPDYSKFPEIIAEDTVKADIEKAIGKLNKRLPTYKQIKVVEIRSTEFEKTTSKKIKRHLVK